MIDKLPGRVNDRKTPLGELDWIFTAVTDTIAWNVLPRGKSKPAPLKEVFNRLILFSLFNHNRVIPKALQTRFASGQLV